MGGACSPGCWPYAFAGRFAALTQSFLIFPGHTLEKEAWQIPALQQNFLLEGQQPPSQVMGAGGSFAFPSPRISDVPPLWSPNHSSDPQHPFLSRRVLPPDQHPMEKQLMSHRAMPAEMGLEGRDQDAVTRAVTGHGQQLLCWHRLRGEHTSAPQHAGTINQWFR